MKENNLLKYFSSFPLIFSKPLPLYAFDGNKAAAHVAYNLSDLACIYPITPSSTMVCFFFLFFVFNFFFFF
jgi:hypothetical protein